MSESLSLNEVPECGQSPSRHWVILGVLLFVHAGLGVVLSSTGAEADRIAPISVNLALGFLFSQPLLLAFWTAFAPQRFYHRILWGLLLCALLSLAVEAEGLFAKDRSFMGRGEFGQRGFFLSMDLILFFAAASFLLLVRWVSRWRLVQLGAEPVPSHYQSHQFGIKHLLALTAIVALVCSLFRNLTLVDTSVSLQPIAKVGEIVFDISSVFAPLALIAWPVLGVRRHIVASAFVTILIIGAVDTAYGFVFLLIWTADRTSDLTHFILPIQLGGALSIVVSTLVMRWCGFRLVRVERGAAVPVQ
jgi:hypothetical protein